MIDVIGFCHAAPFSNYLLENSPRKYPGNALVNAKSIIIAGIYIGGLAMPEWENPAFGRSSRLYLSGFFLDVVAPLQPVADHLVKRGFQARICDTGAQGGSILPLKQAAIRAGLGWQGKHSLLVTRKFGTFLALGGIITDAKLSYNNREAPNRCGKCTQCRQACPMDALEQPFKLNMEQCLSYQLQEESLSARAVSIMENRIGDCEICQNACPWNRKHISKPLQTAMTTHLKKRLESIKPYLYLPKLINMSEEEYDRVFGAFGTQIPYAFFKRNVAIAHDHFLASQTVSPRMDARFCR